MRLSSRFRIDRRLRSSSSVAGKSQTSGSLSSHGAIYLMLPMARRRKLLGIMTTIRMVMWGCGAATGPLILMVGLEMSIMMWQRRMTGGDDDARHGTLDQRAANTGQIRVSEPTAMNDIGRRYQARLKFLLGRSDVQFEGIESRILLSEPQIRLPHRLCTHHRARLGGVAILIPYGSVGDDVRAVDAERRILLCHRLRQAPDGRSATSVRCKFWVCPQRTHRPREDDASLVAATFR